VEELGTNTALLIIDVQRDLFEKSTPVYRGDLVLKNINTLVDRAHAANTTVIEKAISYKVMNREPAGANNVLINDT